jgi:hypothetical protein
MQLLEALPKLISWVIPLIILAVIILPQAIRILREYERGVVFTLGRFWKVKGPGLVLLIPGVQQLVKVDLRTVVFEVPTQDVISPRVGLRMGESSPSRREPGGFRSGCGTWRAARPISWPRGRIRHGGRTPGI